MKHPSDNAQSLNHREAKFHQFFEQHSAIMLLIDPEFRIIVDANRAATEFYGYPLATFRGMTVEKINARPESEMCLQRALVLRGECNQFEVEHRLSDGQIRTVKVLTAPITIDSKSYLFSIIYDITDSKAAEIKLEQQHRRLLEIEAEQRALLRNLHTGIVVYAPDASVIFSNPAAARLLGMSEDQLNGTSAMDPSWRVIDENGKEMQAYDFPVNHVIRSHLAQQNVVLGVQRSDRKDWVWILVDSFPEFDADGNLIKIVANFNDITNQKLLQQELTNQAHMDYLTGLSNRRYFMQQSEAELARAVRYDKNLSLFMMDIDQFKKINDSHGHQIGDLVLKKLAKICMEILREVDIIGRVGGEEFAVLLPETGADEAILIAERIRLAIENSKVAIDRGLPLQFNVSIGVTSLSSEDDNLDVLIARADRALYEAKTTGRNKSQVAID